MNFEEFKEELRQIDKKLIRLHMCWEDFMSDMDYSERYDPVRENDEFVSIQLEVAQRALEQALPSIRV